MIKLNTGAPVYLFFSIKLRLELNIPGYVLFRDQVKVIKKAINMLLFYLLKQNLIFDVAD